jgi:hypothetical protein
MQNRYLHYTERDYAVLAARAETVGDGKRRNSGKKERRNFPLTNPS